MMSDLGRQRNPERCKGQTIRVKREPLKGQMVTKGKEKRGRLELEVRMGVEIYRAGCSGALRPPHLGSEFVAHIKLFKAHDNF